MKSALLFIKSKSDRERSRKQDDSGSNPATPIPTPISPTPSSASVHCADRQQQQVLPEQLAAGIHRLKVEEGMSSGGSSGFPSTPAPATTPFIQHVAGQCEVTQENGKNLLLTLGLTVWAAGKPLL